MKAADALKEIAAPINRDEKIVHVIERTARAVGLGYSRCFELWYGRSRSMDSVEAAQIGAVLEKKRKQDTRNELQELRTRLAKLESRLAQTDEEFYRPTIDQIGFALGRSR